MSLPSRRIFGRTKRRGPLRSKDIHALLGTTAEAARQQAGKLTDERLVEAHRKPRNLGAGVERIERLRAGARLLHRPHHSQKGDNR
jgi:hypothetical protein